MNVDISLHCAVSRDHSGALFSGFRDHFPSCLTIQGRVIVVLRRSLYGVVSDGRVLGLFVPLPPAVLTGFPQGASISLEAGFGRIVFLKSAVFYVFHSRYQSTLIPVPPSIRPS